jgi:hypothetical protein
VVERPRDAPGGGLSERATAVIAALPLRRNGRADRGSSSAVQWLKQTLCSAPVTFAYLFVLAATTADLSSSSAPSDERLLAGLSTNLHQLARVPVRVLVASAFWTSGWVELFVWMALFAAILAPVERRLGWRRMTLTFAAGHLGATMIVAAGLWIGLQLDAVDPAVASARDVGVSYGFYAVAALAAYLLSYRRRICYLAALIGYQLVAAALFHTFTDFGHLTAVAIGLACYPLVRFEHPSCLGLGVDLHQATAFMPSRRRTSAAKAPTVLARFARISSSVSPPSSKRV